MKGHERILFIVDKIKEEGSLGSTYFQTEVVASYVFRTRKAANEFRDSRNKRTKKFKYMVPRRAMWGPDN